MFVVSFLLGVVAIGLVWLHWYQARSRFGKLINQFPQPPMVPLIGQVLNYSRNAEKVFPQIRRTTKSFDESFVLWSGPKASINIVRADDAEIILTSVKHIDKSFIYDFIRPWLGDGLLISTGAKWQQRRKLLTPTFHFNILQKFVEIMGEHSKILIEQIKNEECGKDQSNVIPLITHMALKTICETAMGTKLNEKDKVQSKYVDAIYGVAPTMVERVLCPWYYNDILFSLSSKGIKQNKYVKLLHKFTTDVIIKREENYSESAMSDVVNSNDDQLGIKKKKFAMLDLLISAKKKNEIDFCGIREEVDTFMFEGHDTTTMAICFMLMVLAHHKDIQDKIMAELNEIFGNDDRTATYDDLQAMKYLELCVKESLRLYPSVPIVSRVLKEDTQLTHHVAPAGSVIILHIIDIHRDPKYYPNPETYDPDRFLPKNSRGRHPYTYIPFSAGPRNCIGQKYAMLEMKSVISSIFRNFTLDPISTHESVRFTLDLVLRVNGPIYVKFNERKFK